MDAITILLIIHLATGAALAVPAMPWIRQRLHTHGVFNALCCAAVVLAVSLTPLYNIRCLTYPGRYFDYEYFYQAAA